jgi:hypothetical protein
MKPSKPTQSLKPFIHCPIRFSGKSAPKYRGGGRYWLALKRSMNSSNPFAHYFTSWRTNSLPKTKMGAG